MSDTATAYSILEFNITPHVREAARDKAKELGKLRNSIRKGEGNMVGFLGELCCAKIFGFEISNTYDYDLTDQEGKTYDVKSKDTTVVPRGYYDASVAAYNTKQRCDYYMFVRIFRDEQVYTKGWVMGCIPKDAYFKRARFLKRGQRVDDNFFRVKADCYNLAYNQLDPMPIVEGFKYIEI